MIRYDRRGTNYNSQVIGLADDFTTSYSSPYGGTDELVLIGDVNGDGYGEIVRQLSGSIYIFSRTLELLSTIDLTAYSEKELGLLSDINNDNVLEIGIGVRISNYNWEVRFYNISGNIIYSFQHSNPGSDCNAVPLARFEDGDIFVRYQAIWSGGATPGRRGMIRWDFATNSEVWNYTTGAYNCHAIIFDIDNDGLLEISPNSNTPHNGAYGNGWNGNGTPTTDGELYTLVINDNGTEQFTHIYGGEDSDLMNIYVDFNGGGIYDIVSIIRHGPTYYQGTSHIDSYNPSGVALATHTGVYNGQWGFNWSSVIADIDNDDDEEFIVSCVSSSTNYTLVLGQNLVTIDSSNTAGEVMVAADLMQNPGIEYVMRSGSTLKIVDSNFNTLWSITKGSNIRNWIRVADLDNDEQAEIIFVADSLYVYNSYISLINISLTPHNPPITIPAAGGSFQFDVDINNTGATNYLIDFWTSVTNPSGTQYPILIRNGLNLAAGAAISRDNLTQMVPGTAAAGTYSYNAYVRDHNTWETLAEDSFPFTKLPGDGAPAHNLGWACYGWDEETESTFSLSPLAFSLERPSPNPFNPSTTLSYSLPNSGEISLTVYDIQGREICSLYEGYQAAGNHQAVFDGSQLASGIYFAVLQAGEFRQAQKLALIK